MKNNEKTFVDAYINAYGGTKKQAKKAYKEWDLNRILLLINGYRMQCVAAFYND